MKQIVLEDNPSELRTDSKNYFCLLYRRKQTVRSAGIFERIGTTRDGKITFCGILTVYQSRNYGNRKAAENYTVPQSF